MAKNNVKKTEALKKQCLELLQKNACNFAAAARKVGISRRTVQRWYAEDEAFREEVDDINEELVDFAQSKLMENISAGKEQSIFMFLKTKGKHRGYVERSELQHSGAIDGISGVSITINRQPTLPTQPTTLP